ncbi:DMT family transporter [Sphaerochaeta halotolerans]|uniref:DMT family transporter n=1 Tax=Sphaerochaeta halotolerans TaxID=2293840 RepID=UPI001371FA8D|nr:DMT family transporter [Sphaerochaeta halotolerans]MXI87633.1 EamA family transporter [Sphaerochaeta halotolerans]
MEKTVVVLPRARILGHIAVISTMTFWAVTFVSTKLLLVAFTPAQILMVRSLLGLTLLFAINHRRVGYTSIKDRVLVAAAGMMGIFLYYYLENTALVYTSASNVGVIVATAPFFTLLATHFFLKEDSLKKNYFVGFAISMVGIILLTVGDGTSLDINPFGDFLALLAIMMWGLYTVLTRLVARRGYSNLLVTRDMFFYALIIQVVVLLIEGKSFDFQAAISAPYLYHLLFLGCIASAFCFVSWNYGLRTIGVVKSSFYLYLSPIITIVFASLVLGETFTTIDAIGTAFTLAGLLISEYRRR